VLLFPSKTLQAVTLLFQQSFTSLSQVELLFCAKMSKVVIVVMNETATAAATNIIIAVRACVSFNGWVLFLFMYIGYGHGMRAWN
jgi:hypothetical protein